MKELIELVGGRYQLCERSDASWNTLRTMTEQLVTTKKTCETYGAGTSELVAQALAGARDASLNFNQDDARKVVMCRSAVLQDIGNSFGVSELHQRRPQI